MTIPTVRAPLANGPCNPEPQWRVRKAAMLVPLQVS